MSRHVAGSHRLLVVMYWGGPSATLWIVFTQVAVITSDVVLPSVFHGVQDVISAGQNLRSHCRCLLRKTNRNQVHDGCSHASCYCTLLLCSSAGSVLMSW